MKAAVILLLAISLQVSVYSQFRTDKWTSVVIDTSRQMWGEGNAAWVRSFGVDAFDANRHGYPKIQINTDGYKDIIAGWYYYRNPGGDMTGLWERFELSPKADGMMFTNVNDDHIADFIAVAGADIYWFEVLNQYKKMFRVHKVGSIKATDHLNGQGYLIADIIKGGKPEILLAGGEGIYMAEIPARPDSTDWGFILIAESRSSEGFAAPDIDGDGDLDIVCGDIPEGSKDATELYFYENPGKKQARWSRLKIGSTPAPIDRVKTADLNNDGLSEIILTEERWNVIKPVANLWVFSASSTKNVRNEWNKKSLASHYSLNNLDAADIDNDGDTDIITNEHKGPDLKTFIYLNDGEGNFTEKEIFRGVEMHLGAKLTDLDNDGDLDVVGPAWDKYKKLTILRNDAVTGKEVGKPWFILYDDTATITEASKGFFRFHPSLVAGKDWTKPYDFYNGTLYARYEIISFPSDESFKLSYCIWADVENGEFKTWKETCSPQTPVKKGEIVTVSSKPSADWWQMNKVPTSFSDVNYFRFMGLVVWCKDSKNCSDLVKPPKTCWENRNLIYPFKLRFSIVAVANGEKFSEWNDYVDTDKYNK